MSKGNMFLGYARGKVGSVVFSRLDGQQVTRAYNASPNNPKTYRQATQRMLFASMAQYYKSFRYLIEQGQEGIKEGSASVRAWQSKSLKRLSSLVGTTAMTPNRNGWQFPQGIPVSLTDGSLPSLDYSIATIDAESGNTALVLDFKSHYGTTAELTNMTLGDFLALYPGISNGAQFTIAMAYNSVGGAAAGDPLQYETLALWSEFVLSPEADPAAPFFQQGLNFYTINPAILKPSWGGNFTPLFSLTTINDGGTHAVAAIIPEGLQNDGSGPIAGCVITSYYDGTSWKRSFSPMACHGANDVSQYIATYMTATRSASSDLYLNQSEADVATIQSPSSVTMAYRLTSSDSWVVTDMTNRLEQSVEILTVQASPYALQFVIAPPVGGAYTAADVQVTWPTGWAGSNSVVDGMVIATASQLGSGGVTFRVRTPDGVTRALELQITDPS